MEYTFRYFIENEDGDTVLRGSTYISQTIGEFGECESVDMEIGSAMRYFKKRRELERERAEERLKETDED